MGTVKNGFVVFEGFAVSFRAFKRERTIVEYSLPRSRVVYVSVYLYTSWCLCAHGRVRSRTSADAVFNSDVVLCDPTERDETF